MPTFTRSFLLLTVLALPPALVAQETSTSAEVSGPLRQDITRLEEHIGQANFTCDYKLFAEVEASEFIYTDGSGGLTTRDQDLAGADACTVRQGTYTLDDIRVRRYGDVVVFNALASVRASKANGDPVMRRHRFTDVLVRRGGRWQLAAGHASGLP